MNVRIFYISSVLVVLTSLKIQDPILYGAIEDFTKRDLGKMTLFLKCTNNVLITMMISIAYINIEKFIIFDYISFLSVFLYILFRILNKHIGSYIFDSAKIYLFLYAIFRLGVLLIENGVLK